MDKEQGREERNIIGGGVDATVSNADTFEKRSRKKEELKEKWTVLG